MTSLEWLTQDADLLALLSSWEEEDHSSDGKSSGPESSRPPVKVNATRERVKREKAQLLTCIEQLTAEAKRLRERREQLMRRQGGSELIVVWESMARRQLRARKRAETLNNRLRGMVDTHHTVAKELLRAVARAEQVRQATASSALFGGQIRSDDTYLLPQLVARLQRLSEQWHLPFRRSSAFQRRDGGFLGVKALRDDQLEVVVETTARSAYPYPAGQVEDAIIHYLEAGQVHDEEFSIVMEGKANDLSTGVRVRAVLNTVGLYGAERARVVRRRFRNEESDMLIVSSLNGTLDLSASNLPDTHTRLSEDAWLRVKEHSSLPPLTSIETVRRSRLMFLDEKRPSRLQADQMKKLLKLILECQMNSGQEALERLLIQGDVPRYEPAIW